MDDRSKYQYEGVKWLYEMELLNHPQAINTLKMNILMTSNHIKEVELLIYREDKAMLILLELSWFGRKFRKKQIYEGVHEAVSGLLSSFRFRVTDDPKIMELAINRVKQALTGGKNENDTSNNGTGSSSEQSSNAVPTNDPITGSNQSTETSQEKQSSTEEPVRADVSNPDSKKSE